MDNRVTEILGIRYPIVQAPMSWLTNAELVAAVSNAGGLGVLAANAGQDSITPSIQETVERMRKEIRKVKKLTSKPFGLNILLAKDMTYSGPMIELAIEESVPAMAAVSVDDTDYSETIERLKQYGIKIMLRPTIPTIESAKKAEKSGVDIFVATGFDSGGLAPDSQIGTFSILPLIADNIKSIPILAAGGIGDVRSVRAAFALGAEGVYAGTTFMTTKENPLALNLKEKMLHHTAEDLHLFRSTVGILRSIPTALTTELVEMNKNGASLMEVAKKMTDKKSEKSGVISGDAENDFINAGSAVSLAKEIRPAKELIDDLMQDFINS